MSETFPIFFFYSDWVLLAIRLVLGLIMLRHGWPKLKDLKQTAANFSNMGFHPGVFWGGIAAFLEVFGGLAVIFGVRASLIAMLFGLEMLVVVFWKLFKWKKPFGECEFELSLFALSLALFTFGSGLYVL